MPSSRKQSLKGISGRGGMRPSGAANNGQQGQIQGQGQTQMQIQRQDAPSQQRRRIVPGMPPLLHHRQKQLPTQQIDAGQRQAPKQQQRQRQPQQKQPLNQLNLRTHGTEQEGVTEGDLMEEGTSLYPRPSP